MVSNGVRVLVLAVVAIGAGCEQLPPGLKAVIDHLRRGHPVPADAGVKPDAPPPPDAAAPPEPDAAEPGPTCNEACTPGARRCAPEGVVMQECTQRDDACPDWADDPRCVPCDPDSFVLCPGSGSGGFP